MKATTSEIMRKLDAITIQEYGIPGVVLMENAGRGTYEKILEHFGEDQLRRVVIIAGRGNNGGDGFVIARYLKNKGFYVKVFILGKKDDIGGDARVNLDIIEHMEIDIEEMQPRIIAELPLVLKDFDLIVDAILGTGLEKEVYGPSRDVIEMINNSGKPVVAVDIPSGLSSNNGKVMGVCVKATMTVTFSNPKIGLIVYPGMEYTGKLFVIDICIPKNLQEEEWVWGNYLVFDDVKGLIKRRNANTFKNNFGHLFILAGSEGKTGAASMACEAAMRVGTGLVTLGIPQSLNPILEMKLTEVMTEPLPETKDYSLAFSAYEKVVNLCAGKSALAIGPGISTSEETSRVISQILLQTDLPTVIDADALTLLSQNVSQLKSMKAPKIITPHPGEMGRLIKKSPSEVQANRVEIARDFSQEFCVYTILKGARTVIADPRGHVYINSTGNPAMASGGMGDILTGMVSGFLAQGYSPLDSARLGVFLHGFCGDKWAEHNGDAGLIATDLLNMIPLMMKKLCDG